MANVISRSNNLYSKFVVDNVDLADIKSCLSDFYRSGFNIDSDSEEQAKFENITFPNWVASNQLLVVETKAAAQGPLDEYTTGESIRSIHLHDDTCVGISISTIQNAMSFHRYAAIHPDYRGRNFIQELRWNGLAFLFDYCGYQEFHFERPSTHRSDWSTNASNRKERLSRARGDMQTYVGRVLTSDDWAAIKANRASPYHQFTYNFEEQ